MASYTQCKLRNGRRVQTAWIPSEYAVAGKRLRINEDNGWQVVWVGEKHGEKYVRKLERAAQSVPAAKNESEG
jgi:hypothetical protein